MIGRCPQCHGTDLAIAALEEDYLSGHVLDQVDISFWCPRCEHHITAHLDISGEESLRYMRSMDEIAALFKSTQEQPEICPIM